MSPRSSDRPTRRDLLRFRLDSLLGTRPGHAVGQRPSATVLPGCSAERGYEESAPPWARKSEDHHD